MNVRKHKRTDHPDGYAVCSCGWSTEQRLSTEARRREEWRFHMARVRPFTLAAARQKARETMRHGYFAPTDKGSGASLGWYLRCPECREKVRLEPRHGLSNRSPRGVEKALRERLIEHIYTRCDQEV